MIPQSDGLIRFKCPSCQKVLRVKGQLAGKRVACPNCKKPVIVPVSRVAGASVGKVNVEDLASSLLAEATAAEEAAKPAPKIQMTCPFCDEALELDASLAGKQEPCPRCRNIIKVPQLKDGVTKDWRENTRTGPQFAKENLEKKLEGAWESDRARVSGEALAEAGALPTAAAEPVTVGAWLRRVLVGVACIAVLGGAGYGISRLVTNTRQEQSLDAAAQAFKKVEDKMPRAWRSEYQRALAEFHGRAEEADKAQKALLGAYGTFKAAGGQKTSPEEELLLIEVALTEIDMGGSGDLVTDNKRISWETVAGDLDRIFQVIASQDGQLYGLRRACLKLRAKEQPTLALSLATQRGSANQPVPGGGVSPLAAEQIAMNLAKNDPGAAKKLAALPADPNAEIDLGVRLGYAEGKAYEGNFPEARTIARRKGQLLHRLQALLAITDIAFQTDNATEAHSTFDEALRIADGEMKKGGIPPLVMYQLAWLSSRLGHMDQAQDWAGRIADAGCKAMAQFDILKQKTQNDPTALDPRSFSDKKSLGYAQLLENFARLRPSEAHAALADAEPVWQPMIHIGLMLSGQ